MNGEFNLKTNTENNAMLKLKADLLVKTAEVASLKSKVADLQNTLSEKQAEIIYLRNQIDKLIHCLPSNKPLDHHSTNTPTWDWHKYEVTCSQAIFDYLMDGGIGW